MITLIPAIDIIEGKCVRLTKGDYDAKTVYGGSPAEMAALFESAGFRRLHVVDLDGAKSKHVVNIEALKDITSRTRLAVDFGGGIRTKADAEAAFSAGADAVNVGSAAARDPEEVLSWAAEWPGRIILSADSADGLVAVSGWVEKTSIPLLPFVERFVSCGLRRTVVTDISCDGMLAGPSVGLYRSIISAVPGVELVASGGVSSKEDLYALREAGCYGAIVGKALYEGYMTLADLKEAGC